ncbi:hypothetical protein LINGRAHAP2_LOCUS24340, partial [Linum grandiflorum]
MTNSDSSLPPPKSDPPLIIRTLSAANSTYTDHFTNPLFFSHGENLSILLISAKLTNDNYHVWSYSLSVALSIKNKIHFINDTLPVPNRRFNLCGLISVQFCRLQLDLQLCFGCLLEEQFDIETKLHDDLEEVRMRNEESRRRSQ